MDKFTFGLFLIILTALLVTLYLVHRENTRLHRLANKHRFSPIDNSGVIFEPDPVEIESDSIHPIIYDRHDTEIQYDYIRPRGRFGTQHQNIDDNDE